MSGSEAMSRRGDERGEAMSGGEAMSREEGDERRRCGEGAGKGGGGEGGGHDAPCGRTCGLNVVWSREDCGVPSALNLFTITL